ncbi:uncharacterized protein LOC121870868 [Homarus americanus]|uniref:uncharacterized protein LOC121870868 n=1 Tax=Homarus americanus TaxID=6706 RepID=UPI001C443236|nr:uncharacterized protein LOC121870868 [Homarus americanus]
MRNRQDQQCRGGVRGVATLLLLMVVTGLLRPASCDPIVAKCPSGGPLDNQDAFCKCILKQLPRSRSNTVNIKCDFDNMEDVVLNKELFPFRNASLVSAYVRMVNATSVHVTKEFLKEWLQAPSAALDIWRGGNLTLESTPPLDNLDKFSSFRTFAGIGIVSCYIPEIPPKFLRDRTRAGFRIKTSSVGTFRTGFLHNIKEMRYLVMEDSVVKSVEGSVASEGYVILSKRQVHTWSGVSLSNVTFQNIGAGAFNLTHHSDMESLNVTNCRLGTVGTEAFTVVGDIEVNITGNYVQKLEKEAFKVKVTGDVKFDENVIESWEPDALEGLMCHNRTSLERNTIHVSSAQDAAINESFTLFHNTCGNPQLFLIINPTHPVKLRVNTTSTWVLTTLLVLVVAVGLGVVFNLKTKGGITRYYTRGRLPIILNGRKSSQENLPNSAEVNLPTGGSTEEGHTNPMSGTWKL